MLNASAMVFIPLAFNTSNFVYALNLGVKLTAVSPKWNSPCEKPRPIESASKSSASIFNESGSNGDRGDCGDMDSSSFSGDALSSGGVVSPDLVVAIAEAIAQECSVTAK